MKTLLVIFSMATVLYGQGPRGHWSGAIDIPGKPLTVEIDLDLDAGAWIGSVSVPEQNVSGVPLENIGFVGGRWTFRMKGSPGSPTYVGSISPDGKTMTGEFTQGANTIPFKLLRIGDAKVDLPKSSPAVTANFAGTWEGALQMGNGAALHLELKLANDESGAKALLITVDRGGGEIPITSVEQTGAKLDLQINMVGAQYKAEIDKEGRVLTGSWIQSGSRLPLIFHKKSAQ